MWGGGERINLLFLLFSCLKKDGSIEESPPVLLSKKEVMHLIQSYHDRYATTIGRCITLIGKE